MTDEKNLLSEIAKTCPECYGVVAKVVRSLPTIEAVPVSATQDEDFRIASEVRMAVGCNTAKECWELARNGDIQVVKHGRWIVETDCEGKTRRCICNQCGFKTGRYTWKNPKYCENCGAKMDLDEVEE